jgi:K+ transporter
MYTTDFDTRYISRFPDAYSNPFYNCAPKGTVIPSLVIAILAAIVASQAIITATFQASPILANRASTDIT